MKLNTVVCEKKKNYPKKCKTLFIQNFKKKNSLLHFTYKNIELKAKICVIIFIKLNSVAPIHKTKIVPLQGIELICTKMDLSGDYNEGGWGLMMGWGVGAIHRPVYCQNYSWLFRTLGRHTEGS